MWVVLRLPVVVCALFLTPHALAAALRPRQRMETLAPLTGLLSVGLNVALLLLFHVTGTPICAPTLAAAHAMLALAACAAAWWRHRFDATALFATLRWDSRMLAIAAAAFAVLVFPFTDLAGIDTYKWQDLATSVRMDRTVPWLIHPLSAFGFSPRAYPVVQPLLLATAQILGGLGVNAGYYAVSLLCGLMGLANAYRMGSRFLDSERAAALFAVLYLFSPVFLRYAHWATGRGFCLALLPLFAGYLLEFPRPRAIAGALLTAIPLAASHKAGTVAVLVLPALHLAGYLLTPRSRLPLAAAAAASALATVAFAPRLVLPSLAGHALGAARFLVTRFGVLAPAAIVAGAWRTDAGRPPRGRALFVPLVALLPLSCHPLMYPAMIALPYVAAFAAIAVLAAPATLRVPFTRVLRPTRPVFLSAVACLALATILHRSITTAAPPDVRVAARLLNALDPQGPYTVTAPDGRRRQIQAYADGFARFTLSGDTHLNWRRPPPWRGQPARVLADWVNWLRDAVYAADDDVRWYGKSPRQYYVIVRGRGVCPATAIRVAAEGDVVIYRDAASPPPAPGR